ncbi:ATP-binding cassette domain-containing protein [Faecalibacillus intestinalis]|uniref:ATP-binding cassette domain-containing protein n=1 Tax=Faecalibacillus intestinalis TaxID=1982626 RepID=UPI002E78EB66|nr:ATP-binding cassette domain-containing protein [Faecalibacillus intestinalis]MEE0281264.1 ATP-binding cassette domain-containing protein [Faecalibacillus intestinalis]
MIEMKHINLSFKDKALFVDQEIKIDSGKITLITGESGSGKSTLLFELARLTDYADKEYIYENEKMSDLDEESFRRKIAFVFQDCRLFNDLSVIQNIEFFSQLGEVEFKKDKMMNLLDELDLNIDLNGEVKVLSGGQKQRLLILCCMMKDPEIIFLDEPTAYLDDVNRRRMRKIIYDLCYKYHKTVVIASHDLDMLEIADKHYHIESQQILLKKNIIKENKNLIARKTIQTFPLNYYLHAQKSNKVHYKRNIIISFLMIIMTYMMCFQAYYQKETERMINKAIDNELRISYKDGGNAYDMAGTPVSRTLVQDLSQNNMIQNISPFFEWNVAHMTVNDSSFKETVVIQPYYKKMKTVKRSNDPVFSIDKQKINTDKIYISYSLYQKIKGHIHLTGTMQVLKNNEFEFVEIPFELSNTDTVDKDIGNRYTKSTENIIYISQNLYQKIINQCIPDATYQSNVYILKINSYKNIQAVTDFIKKHDQQIKVYNPVSSTILNQTTSFGFEMIYNFSKIIFILFVLSCFIIGIFDIVTRRYQYALLLVNGFNKKQCLKLILKERINYCLLSIVLAQVSVMGIFYLQYHTLASIIIERAFSVLMIVNLIILFVPCVTFIILMKINNEGNMLKTSEE